METSLRRAVMEAKAASFASGDELAAVAVILWGPELELLVIRRALRSGDPWSGHMALPGGRMEPFDKNLEATALRETQEEVGIDLREAELWGALQPQPTRGTARAGRLWVTPFVYRIDGLKPAVSLDHDEVAEVLWIPVTTLLSPQAQTTRLLRRKEGTLKLPAWQIGSRVIWGLTHAILSQLLKHAL